MNTTKCVHNNNHPVQPGRNRRTRLTTRMSRLIVFTVALAWCPGARAQQAATATATLSDGSVTSIVVTSGGSGYVAAPAVTFVGGGGTGASAIAQVSGQVVADIVLQSPGSGYTNAPVIAIDPPPLPVRSALLSISMVPDLIITGQAWQVQEVQYADALGTNNQWGTLTNFVMSGSHCMFVDTSAPSGARFYRVITLGAPEPEPSRWAWINPGTFTMGSPDTEYDRSNDESPQTQVTFTYGFWMERFELSQAEYTALIGTNYSVVIGTNQPVDNVSWFDAANYCAQLTLQERSAGRLPSGYVYRLPTEAEWEYVCRAGTTNRFSFGDDHTYALLPDYAWFNSNSLTTTHDGGGKLPNPWGVYDMSGNVWEWCSDFYGPYSGVAVTNSTGPTTGANVVMRGGSAFFSAGDARCAARNYNPPGFASHGIGIRVVLGPPLD